MIAKIKAFSSSLIGGEFWLMALAVVAGLVSSRLLPAAVVTALALAGLRWISSGKLSMRTPVDLPVIILLLCALVTMLVTAFPQTTVPQVWRLLSGIGLFYSLANWAKTRHRLGWITYGMVLAGVGLVALAPFSVTWYTENKMSFVPDFVYSRSTLLVSDTIHPNAMGGILALLLPVPISLLVFNWHNYSRLMRVSLMVVCLLMAGMLFLTKSRGAWMGFGAGIAVVTFFTLARSWKTLLGLSIAGLLGLVGLASSPIGQKLFALDLLGGVEGRLEIFSRSLLMIRDFPFTGIGMGSFDRVVDTFYPFFLYSPGQIVHAHNLFLQIAVDLGLPGLIAWLAIYGTILVLAIQIFRQGRQGEDHFLTALGAGMVASQTALGVHGLTDAVTWGMVRPAPLVWALWGLVVALKILSDDQCLRWLAYKPAGDSGQGLSNPAQPARLNILGVGVSAIDLSQAVAHIQVWIEKGYLHYVCVTPAHGIMDCQREPGLRRIFNQSGMTTPDGMSIVWLLRLHGYAHVRRVYGPDLMLRACEKSLEHGWRHYFYGGETQVLEKLVAELTRRFPGLQVAGAYSPPFRPLTAEEDQDVVERINRSGADIVWVGIGTPKQERWMADHRPRIHAPLMVGVGAAFDFLSGSKPQAPRWVQRSGLEWLFRLVSEPGRLWKRYIQYPWFALLVLAQELGFKQYSID